MWRTGHEVAQNAVRKKIIEWNGDKHKQRKLTSIVHNSNPHGKTTCWTPKATADGKYSEGFENGGFPIVWRYHKM